MKQITTIAVTALLAISVVSCSKSSYSDEAGQTPSKQPDPPIEVTVVGKWLSPVSFSVEIDRLGNQFIIGTYPFTPANQISYNEVVHMELAYARIPTNQRMPYQYNQLPFVMSVENNGATRNVSLDYSLDPDGLELYFKNAEYSFLAKAADLSISENWNFLYIVIPKSKYQSLRIDWSNLHEVAAALNFSL